MVVVLSPTCCLLLVSMVRSSPLSVAGVTGVSYLLVPCSFVFGFFTFVFSFTFCAFFFLVINSEIQVSGFDADSGPATQAHQHISQTHKRLSENTFIITFEIPVLLALDVAFLPRSSHKLLMHEENGHLHLQLHPVAR